MGFAKRQEKTRSVLSVPIFSNKRIFACVAMRYFSSAVSEKDIKSKYLPALLEISNAIGQAFGVGRKAAQRKLE
jgi:hypothetical protein